MGPQSAAAVQGAAVVMTLFVMEDGREVVGEDVVSRIAAVDVLP